MARLASQADLGFKPLPIEAAYNIGTFIAPTDHPQARIFDPCVGEGEGIQVIARGIGIPKERRFACELHDDRATTASERVGNLVIADAIKNLQASRHGFVAGYMNPPFDNEDKSEGGGRLETRFLYRAIEDGRWIQPGGLAVIVTPQYIMARQAFLMHLARCYDDIQVFALREDLREFNEAVAFGVVRKKFRTGDERRDEEERLTLLLKGNLPVLAPQDAPHYTLPEPEARKKPVLWRDSSRGTPTMAQREVCTLGGAWNGDAYRHATAALQQRQRLNPKFPLHPGQRVFRIAAGEVNGRILEFDGQSWTIKGSTIEETHHEITSTTSENSTVTRSTVIKKTTPVITAVNADGLLRQYIGAGGIGKLLADPAVSAALSEAVTEAAPPTYQLDMEPWLEELLGSIKPKKALPGYAPGLLPMQKHVISAAYRALTTHDPAWGRTPNSTVIAAEMGCGKTAMGLVSAHALITARPPKGRAPTIIVTGPGHLIGTRQQVVEFFRDGKGSLPPWYKEWHELLPNYHLDVLESPADVGDFFRGAEDNPDTPRVGFISNTKLSLGSGYECGAQDYTNSKAAWAHFRRYHDLEEVERAEFAPKKKKGGSQEESDATAEEEERKNVIAHPHLESPRTRRRDEMLRTAPGHPRLRNGLTCPTCGTLVRAGSKGDPADEKTLRKKGLARLRCHHCGEHLGQMARERDNVQDRERPAFQSERWLRGHPDVPWGVIPQSNPRYPLGKLIRERYKDKVDVYVADEVHDYKGATTAVGAAFGALAATARWTIGLTGTLYGGYGSTLYSLFLRMGNVPILREYGWNDEKRFVKENGVVAEITTEIQRNNEAGHYSGEPSVRTEFKEMPGVTAALGAVVQNQSIQVLLKHMGFNLVDYVEDAAILDMPDEVAPLYRSFNSSAKGVVQFGGEDALGAYLQAMLTYPYQPWREKVVHSEKKDETATSEILSPDLVLPHHTWLAEYASKQVQAGRRVLVFCQHTGRDDIMPDIAEKVARIAEEEHGTLLKIAMLRSTTVKSGERAAWFAKREAEGCNVVLCNPALVKTGLNLVGWPSIVVLEPIYSLYTAAQAVRRAFRPTQTETCEVTYLAYADSMSERALEIVAEKMAAMALLSGDEISDGVASVSKGDSLMQELAKLVREGEGGDVMNRDVRAALAANAKAFTDEMRNGAENLLVGNGNGNGNGNGHASHEDIIEAEVVVAATTAPEPEPEPEPEPQPAASLAEKLRAKQATRRRKKNQVSKDQTSFFDLM